MEKSSQIVKIIVKRLNSIPGTAFPSCSCTRGDLSKVSHYYSNAKALQLICIPASKFFHSYSKQVDIHCKKPLFFIIQSQFALLPSAQTYLPRYAKLGLSLQGFYVDHFAYCAKGTPSKPLKIYLCINFSHNGIHYLSSEAVFIKHNSIQEEKLIYKSLQRLKGEPVLSARGFMHIKGQVGM